MNGAIVRDLLLVATANRALSGRDVTGFWPGAECFTHLRHFRFLDGQATPIAEDPLAWFAALAGAGVRGLRVAIAPAEQFDAAFPMPERQLSGFANAGPVWLIETVEAASSECWRVIDERVDEPDGSVSAAAFGLGLGGPAPADARRPELPEARAALDAALDPMIALAAREGMTDPFGRLCQHARRLLADPNASWPSAGYYLDFERFAGFDAGQMRVLAAITHAWVFGGMGSWNDVGPDGPEPDRLFAALVDASAALANATAPD